MFIELKSKARSTNSEVFVNLDAIAYIARNPEDDTTVIGFRGNNPPVCFKDKYCSVRKRICYLVNDHELEHITAKQDLCDKAATANFVWEDEEEEEEDVEEE